MKCIKCGKHFDEEMYSCICPKCGTYNRHAEKYNVNQYYSANFGEDGKVSTDAQARAAHEELHRMYEGQNVGQAHSVHRQTPPMPNVPRPVQQAPNIPWQKQQAPNTPWGMQRGMQAAWPVQQINRQPAKQMQAEKRSVFVPVMLIIIVVTVLITVFVYKVMQQNALKQMTTLDYETAEHAPGETFELEDREITVTAAGKIDTEVITGMPEGEKMIAVTLNVEELEGADWDAKSEVVYVNYPGNCRQPLAAYEIEDMLVVLGINYDRVLSAYNYLRRADGAGFFLFMVDEDVEEIELVLDEMEMEKGVLTVKTKHVIPLELAEE